MRLRFIIAFFIIIWLVLLVRIYFISIKSNTYYEELASRNVIKKELLTPMRGSIYDRLGRPLAVNMLGFSLAISPGLSRKSRLHLLEEEINFILSMFPDYSKEELIKTYKRADSPYNHDFIPIIEFIPYAQMSKKHSKILLRESLKIIPATKRYYPNGEVASHIIGYVSKANQNDMDNNPLSKYTNVIGKSGVERYYNEFLQGELGYRKAKNTALNQEIEEVEKVLPVENNDITLTIDIELQKFITDTFRDISGAIVVMDVNNGEILSAGSFPEYDINKFVTGISFDDWNEIMTNLHKPFTNKLINGLYPPGSVIKMGVGLSFLESGLFNEGNSFSCSGDFEYGGHNFRCWNRRGHGETNLVKAIRESCDDYFYKGSLRVGIEQISKTLRQMGLGEKTGIDLPNEFMGVVPSKEWKEKKYKQSWFVGETIISSIGQGYNLTTPLQIARFTSLLASGKLPTPHLAKSLKEREQIFEPIDILSNFQKSKLPILRRGMYEVCNVQGGTAVRYVKNTKVKVAGKTGTAQVVSIPQDEKRRMLESELEYFSRSHSWLTVYAPVENPKYSITVLVEHGGNAGGATGWIIEEVINYMIELGYLQEEPKI